MQAKQLGRLCGTTVIVMLAVARLTHWG